MIIWKEKREEILTVNHTNVFVLPAENKKDRLGEPILKI
jgi:hypothetical protein